INPRYGAPADANRDGSITLTELYNALLENHAASTPQVYPQEDDFVVFTYNLAERETMNLSDRSPIGDVTFSSSTLSRTDNELSLEFIALRPVRVAYQVVYRRENKWRFDEAQLLFDNVERYTAYGDEEGAISPGRKLRTLTLNLSEGDESGYVIVQLVSIENGKLTVHAGRVIAVPPDEGDPALTVEVGGAYTPGSPREMAIFVGHTCPCELSVSIVNESGETVRKLCHRQSTRPLKICGSTFYWNGRDQNGDYVAPGTYQVRVTGYLGNRVFTADSGTVVIGPADA
ncbi:MAG: FlgD immunoglobulin-like domain containing protein, partial [Eubacteriales bacterium]|nr:FlgD immunoglobulin-like domain containing protein [Eubacteriales bacterium]